MRIRVSQMERMFHMSPNGIKLYEKHGIIRPERGRENGHRVYDWDDVLTMACAVSHRRYGFSMSETACLLERTGEEQTDALRRRADELEAEIDGLVRLRKGLRTQVKRAERAAALLSRCVIEEKPAMYFLGLHRAGKQLGEKAEALVGAWVERYAPHLSSAALLDGPYFTENGYDAPPLAGVVVDAEIALELGLMTSEHVTYLPPKPCVVTAVRMVDGESFAPVIERVRDFARAEGLTLYAGGLIRLVSREKAGEQCALTGLLWAPIGRDDRRFGGMK